MSTQIGWPEIALRIVLTLLAGAIIGLDRGEHGRPAGLRTVMLVCLAASLSMIQVNLLLGMSGKTPASFAVMDLMRLPLGILTGVGFIGAGSILRKGSLIRGVTTAATLWYVTVLGLLLGGGQLALGVLGTLLGWLVLCVLKWTEAHWHRDQHGTLTIVCDAAGPGWRQLDGEVKQLGGRVRRWTHLGTAKGGRRKQSCEVTWNPSPDDPKPPPFFDKLCGLPGVTRVEWRI